MPRFPSDAPKPRVLRAFQRLGFEVIRERSHIVMERRNQDGSTMPAVLPNHRRIKGHTLQSALRQAGVDRDEFLSAYEAS